MSIAYSSPATERSWTAHSVTLADGDRGTEQTIAAMRRLIAQGVRSPKVNRTAIEILRTARVRAYDDLGEVRALYEWVKRNVRFTKDIAGVETLRPAADTLEVLAGDCDDFTVLLASLLGTVGYRTRIVTISANADAPRDFSHVYPEVLINGHWYALDAARPGADFGRRPPRFYRMRVWEVDGPTHRDIRGLGRGLGAYTQRETLGAWYDFLGPLTQSATSIIKAVKTPAQQLIPPPVQYTPADPRLLAPQPSGQGNTLFIIGILGIGALLLMQARK